jgi:hypothetical protein
MNMMNTSIILVLRALGRLFDVCRGEDEYSWPPRYHAAISDPFILPSNANRLPVLTYTRLLIIIW